MYYGIGWPTTFTFTIPNSYEMPAVGYIDIELNLTNLVPDDNNIYESGGKYYYRASSKGSKTLNFKTATSQSAAVGVELVHNDFISITSTQATRSYVSIAAQKIQFNNGNYNTRTVTCYSDSGYNNRVGSFTGTSNNRRYYNGAFTFTGIVDANQTIYMRYVNGNRSYVASATAIAMYNGTTCNITQ